MPQTALKPCNHPGCRALVRDRRYCPAHTRDADAARPAAAKRGYNATWRKIRYMVLRERPLCEYPGCDQAATDVHHKKRIADGGDNSVENLQPLCHAHHSRITGARH